MPTNSLTFSNVCIESKSSKAPALVLRMCAALSSGMVAEHGPRERSITAQHSTFHYHKAVKVDSCKGAPLSISSGRPDLSPQNNGEGETRTQHPYHCRMCKTTVGRM